MLRTIKRKGVCNKKRWIITLSIFAVAGALSYLVFQMWQNYSENKHVATVNGDPIYLEEFRERLLMQRIPVKQFFTEKYGAKTDGDFWESSYGGENPLEKAKDLALKECVKIKVEQQLGRGKGVLADIGYPAFLKQLEKENKRRKKAVENNEVIYGPIEYQREVYYEYLRSNMEIKLKELLESKEIQFREEDLKKYYEQSKDRLYRKEGSIRVIKIYVPYAQENGTVTTEKREEALKKIEEVKLKLSKGNKIEDITGVSGSEEPLEVVYKEQIFDEKTAKQDAQKNSELRSQARELSIGETSDIKEENNTFYFIKCVEKEPDGYKAFEEVKENVKVKFIDEKYKELIDKLVKAAKVEIIEDAYERVTME